MDRWLVDTDPAIGLRWRDVDDALALHALAHTGGLAGITTVFGNAPAAQVRPIAEGLAARWGVPVHHGACAPGDTDTAAVEALVRHQGPVLGLGPCTNLAAALRRGARWSALVLLGGTTRGGPNVRYVRLTELNFALDPLAAAVALAHATLLVPMEACRQVVFTAADLAPLPADLRAACASWLRIAPWLTGTDGFHPWDLVGVAAALRPELVRVEARPTSLELRWPWRGILRPEGRPLPTCVAVDTAAIVRWWRSLV